jgi:hypothetical protein
MSIYQQDSRSSLRKSKSHGLARSTIYHTSRPAHFRAQFLALARSVVEPRRD